MTTLHSTPQANVMIKIHNFELWAESFGDKGNPAIILIMGSGGQGVLWPLEFCEELAAEGYFVIHFDHRDTGLSSSFNFEVTSYTLLDMANDVVHIMDYYELKSSHIVGASMGGVIAMLLGAHFSERVRSLTLMITTLDMRPVFDAYQGLSTQHVLPGPEPHILKATKELVNYTPVSLEEKIQLFIQVAKINSGSILPDETLCRALALLVFKRMKNSDGANNHYKACLASHELHTTAIDKINKHTCIIHGDEDPIFPLQHGYALQNAIKKSRLFVIPGLGHSFVNKQFFKPVITHIVSCAKAADSEEDKSFKS